MPLGTLDGTPPPFFRQGPSALSKLTFCSVLALFLMVADARFSLVQPLRVVLATVLYPVQWLALRPVVWSQESSKYLESRSTSQSNEEATQRKLDLQSLRANQVEQLSLENARLRQLLGLRERVTTPSLTAQVLYDAADPYTRKVIIDRGLTTGVVAGSPVLDEAGVLGQVTRVYPLVSEVTLVTDRDQAIPVLNTRTGARGVAFGDPALRANGLELRFMAANADVQVGDLLTTSGVDGVYPPGLPVAKVSKVDRRADSAFARISCLPLALVAGVGHVIVLKPLATQIAPRPAAEPPPGPGRKGSAK
jgi:rod shape-determining protein MreC